MSIELDQSSIDEIFQFFISGKKSASDRLWFYQEMNTLFDNFCVESQTKLRRRMDWSKNNKGRTLGEFALCIYDGTIRERFLIDLWGDAIKKAGNYSVMNISDAGSDNTGKVYILQQNSRGADYIVSCVGKGVLADGVHSIEMKFAPSNKKLTYKVADLKNYYNRSESILTIIGDNSGIGPNGKTHLNTLKKEEINLKDFQWCFFGPDTIEKLLMLPTKIEYTMGGKECVRIMNKEFSNYFDLRGF